jgi:CHASE2 domain-containing sensor protein
MLVRLSGAMQPLELFLFDRFMRWRPPEPIDDRVVVVGIDEDDIRNVGYPVPDAELAKLISTLESYQPRAIGLDIFRDLAIEPGGDLLAQLFRSQENLIGVEKSILPGEVVYPPPSLPEERIGFVDTIQDFDGHVRRVLLSGFTNYDPDQYHFCSGLKLAEWYLWEEGIEIDNGIRDPGAIRFRNAEFASFKPNDGGYVGADAGANQSVDELAQWGRGLPRFRWLMWLIATLIRS